MRELDWGRAMRMLGAARGLSQAELAAAAGISPSHLAEIRAGRRTKGGRQSHPSFDTLLRLAEAGGVDASLVVSWAEGVDRG